MEFRSRRITVKFESFSLELECPALKIGNHVVVILSMILTVIIFIIK